MKFFSGKNKKSHFLILLSGFFIFSICLIYQNNIKVSAQITENLDAIGIRVIPNPEHLSPLRWYRNQNFTGSPQSITVDGYEGIRDGRSVYVNAANISAGQLYTNIYLISYNQDAENETMDIFGRILSKWKFNTNILGFGNCSEPMESNIASSDCTGTIGCWHFDGDFKDSSISGNDGVGLGDIAFSDSGAMGKAISLDGINDYVRIDNNLYKTPSFTVSVWIYHDITTGSGDAVLGNEEYGGGPWKYGYMMRFWTPGNNNNLEFIVSNNNNYGMGSTKVPLYKWMHIALSYDSASCTRKIYKNGILISPPSVFCAKPYIPSLKDDLFIGLQHANPSFFHGLIDEVKIYDYAISDSDVLQEYSNVYNRCLTDADCEGRGYCSGPKANITRDTIRLSRLVDFNLSISEYKNKTGRYPVLAAGTYIPNSTLSTWPSWQESLGKELGTTLPLDPINKLGQCLDYDETTCWNKDLKKFADSDLSDPSLNPPKGSNVFVYSGSTDGSSYNICSVMESGYVYGAGSGACAGSATVSFGETTINTGPKFIGSNLQGNSGEIFNGYLAGMDPEGDLLSWSINTSMTSWTLWSAPPILQNTPVANQKKIYSLLAGKAGNYGFSATIGDGISTTTNNFNIKIVNNPPTIFPNNTAYTASSTVPLYYKLTAQDSSSNYPLSYKLAAIGGNIIGPVDSFTLSGGIYNFEKKGNVTPGSNVFNSSDSKNLFNYSIYVGDKYDATSTANFTITVINNSPQLTIPPSCAGDVRVGKSYICQPTAVDPEGNIITYGVGMEFPIGLTIDPVSGLIEGNPSIAGHYNITVIATDEYNYKTEKIYKLDVNTYCEDGIIQDPNDEGLGGENNDGKEECDDGNEIDVDVCDTCQWTCKALAFSDITLTPPHAKGDNIIFDDNNDTNSVNEVAGGAFLKIDKSMPTPYIWIANSNRNLVSKLRTFDGLKKDCIRSGGEIICDYIDGVIEQRGENLGNFSVGSNPSRTAVNAETGDVWIANRNSNNVHKLDINGTILKICAVGGGPRGLAIEKDGNVWVANCTSGNAMLLPGNDTDCAPITTVNLGGECPYGLTIDTENNIWINRRADSGRLVKIDTVSNTVSNSFPLYYAYGITADKFGNIWIGRSEGVGVYEYKKGAAGVSTYGSAPPYNIPYRTTGVTQDLSGNIWFSAYYNARIIKVNQSGSFVLEQLSGGSSPHGIVSDSKDQIWAVNRGSNSVRVFDSAGTVLSVFGTDPEAMPGDVYCINDINGNGNCADDGVEAYTYSDMTGLNRAMLLRSGNWKGAFDSGFDDQKWGNISWDEVTPAGTEIKVELRASNDKDFVSDSFMLSTNWNALSYKNDSRSGRYLQISITMRSNVDAAPVLTNLRVECDGPALNTSPTSMYIPNSNLVFPIVNNSTVPDPYQCAGKPLGLLNWWTGDNNTQDIISGNNGTVQNGAGYTTEGKVGSAFNFNGANQYIKIDNEIKSNTEFTEEGWVKINPSGSGEQSIFTTRNGELYYNKNNNSFLLQIFADRNGCFSSTPATRYYYNSTIAGLIEGFWTHVAMVVYNTNTADLYINGTKLDVSARITDNTVASDYNTTIGGNTPRNSEYFNGAIDEISFYNRALAADEINSIYLAHSAGKCKNCVNTPGGLVSWWPGDGNADDIKDGNNGTGISGVAYPNGKVDKAFSFNGSSSYVSVPHNNNLNMNPATGISFGAWVYPTDKNQEGYIIAKYIGNGEGYWMGARDGKYRISAGNSDCSNNSTPLEYELKANAWTHVMATISTGNPATIKLYINGILRKLNNNAYACNNTVGFRIGNSTNGSDKYFKGQVDEVMFFNKELLDAEVKSIFNSGSSGTCKYCSFPLTFPCVF